MRELFEQYAELKRVEKEVAAKIKELQPSIIEAMGENEEVETNFGMFVIGKRRAWKYPAEVEVKEQELKEAKKECEQLGTATYEENPYLIFKNNE